MKRHLKYKKEENEMEKTDDDVPGSPWIPTSQYSAPDMVGFQRILLPALRIGAIVIGILTPHVKPQWHARGLVATEGFSIISTNTNPSQSPNQFTIVPTLNPSTLTPSPTQDSWRIAPLPSPLPTSTQTSVSPTITPVSTSPPVSSSASSSAQAVPKKKGQGKQSGTEKKHRALTRQHGFRHTSVSAWLEVKE